MFDDILKDVKIERIPVGVLEPGDKILVKIPEMKNLPRHIYMRWIKLVAEKVKESFPDNDILVATSGIDLEIIKT